MARIPKSTEASPPPWSSPPATPSIPATSSTTGRTALAWRIHPRPQNPAWNYCSLTAIAGVPHPLGQRRKEGEATGQT